MEIKGINISNNLSLSIKIRDKINMLIKDKIKINIEMSIQMFNTIQMCNTIINSNNNNSKIIKNRNKTINNNPKPEPTSNSHHNKTNSNQPNTINNNSNKQKPNKSQTLYTQKSHNTNNHFTIGNKLKIITTLTNLWAMRVYNNIKMNSSQRITIKDLKMIFHSTKMLYIMESYLSVLVSTGQNIHRLY